MLPVTPASLFVFVLVLPFSSLVFVCHIFPASLCLFSFGSHVIARFMLNPFVFKVDFRDCLPSLHIYFVLFVIRSLTIPPPRWSS